MKELVERYSDKKTGKVHEVRVDEEGDRVVLWYLYWGEYRGVDDHHHMGIAEVRETKQGYTLGFLHGTEQRPDQFRNLASIHEVFAALDEEIARR